MDFYKNNPTDKIGWQETPDDVGLFLFSFDRVKVYNLFQDFPEKLSKEEVEIFCKENPFWANFFNDRLGVK